ncbi:MAG: cupin domain-containing protein [Bryobacteraceae bacterium]
MTQHQTANDEVRELASLFAAGALPQPEADQFRQHLKNCDVCAEETRSFQEAAGLLVLSGSATPAPAHVRERLLARTGRQRPPDGIRVVRAQEGEWFPLVPGVTAKRLYEESPGGNVALLVKMEAGAVYPPHEHADVEHAYVLSGDLHFGDLVLGAGDYQCALTSSAHVKSHSESGCTVLIIASQQNRFLPWNR